MTPGEKIKRLLSDARRSTSWLARRAGVSGTAIGRVVKGGSTAVEIALRITDALCVDVRWLWSDADWPEAGPVQSADSPRRIVKTVTTVTETYFE